MTFALEKGTPSQPDDHPPDIGHFHNSIFSQEWAIKVVVALEATFTYLNSRDFTLYGWLVSLLFTLMQSNLPRVPELRLLA